MLLKDQIKKAKKRIIYTNALISVTKNWLEKSMLEKERDRTVNDVKQAERWLKINEA